MKIQEEVVSPLWVPVVGAILTMLLGGNVFFVKRLVDKIDGIDQRVWEQSQSIAVMKITVEDLAKPPRLRRPRLKMEGHLEPELQKGHQPIFGRAQGMEVNGLRLPLQKAGMSGDPYQFDSCRGS